MIEKFDDSDFYPKTDFKLSSNSVDLSVLVDNAEPQYFPAWSASDASRNVKTSERQNHQPPAVANQCPRRIRLVIMLQTLCKFTVTGISQFRLQKSATVADKPISRSLLTTCLEKIIGYGIHAVFIHLVTDTSRYCNLTFSDKQYILWILREHIVLSIHLSYPAVNNFLVWIHWLLKCDVVYNNVKLTSTGRESKKDFSRAHTTAAPVGSEKLPPSAITILPPISNPAINLSIRFCALQELRFLFVGMDSNRSYEYDGECRPYRIPLFDDSNKGNSEEDFLLIGNTPLISTVAKEMLTRNGFVELLVDVTMGKLCSRCVFSVMSALSGSSSSSLDESLSQNRISELEKEEWFCALATLAQLSCGFDRAKAVIDSHIGLQSLFYFFFPILNFLSHIPESVLTRRQKILSYPVDYRPTIINLLIELCLSGERFVAPHSPYNQADLKFPMLLSVKSVLEEPNNSSNSSSSFPSSKGNISAASKVNFTAVDVAIQIFYNREFLVGSRGTDIECSDQV